MKIICVKPDFNGNKSYLTLYKKYEILEIRRWDNGYVQYKIIDDKEEEVWLSSNRFSKRKEKLKILNNLSK